VIPELLSSVDWSGTVRPLVGVLLIAVSLRQMIRKSARPSSDGIDEIDLRRGEDPSLPEDLKPAQAQLLFTEGVDPRAPNKPPRVFYCDSPVPLNGVPDEIYELRDSGALVLVDTKPMGPRDRVWLSEKIQLSAYKVILERGYGAPVADHAYIRRADNTGNSFFVRTDLFTEQEVVEFYLRYQLLAAGNRYPALPPSNPALCRSCESAKICPHQAA